MAKHNPIEDLRKANALADMDKRGEVKLSTNEIAAVRDVLGNKASDASLIIVNDTFKRAQAQTMESQFDGR